MLFLVALFGLTTTTSSAAASLKAGHDDPLLSRAPTHHAPAILSVPAATYPVCFAVGETSGKLIRISTSGITVKGDTGRSYIEAIALSLDGNTLYAADAGQFGTINMSNGNWTSIGSGFGTGSGSEGNINLNDVDGLAFDPTTGILYGTHRRSSDNDLLFQINVSTGTYVNNAFGGNDYVEIERYVLPGSSDDLFDVDDIAIDPSSGQMYGLLNRGGDDHRLFTINKSTGAISSPIGSLNTGGKHRDMEGLTITESGVLIGSTGRNGDSDTNNNLYFISKSDGSPTFIVSLTGDTDFEGVACPTGDNTPDPPDPTCPAGLDIDGQSTGAFVDGENLFPGITVSVSGAGNTGGNPRRAMIFNTASPTGGDTDLGTPNQAFGGPGVGSGGASGPGANTTAQGKAIIISEDNDQGDPDDSGSGGTITFTFDGLVDFDSIALLDIENSGSSVTAKDINGNVIKTVSANAYGDNSYDLLAIDADDVKSLEVFFNNESGAIADLFYCSIDLECATNAAPLLDFQNLTDAGQAPEGGDELKFTAPFTNNADASDTATGVEVTVTFPTSQFTYVPGSATGGTSQDVSNAASGEIVFTLGSLAPGATATLMFNLTVNSGATEGNVSASVTAAGQPDKDSLPDNLGLIATEDDECQTGFTALPVELTAFEAQADGRAATLRWRTASETNNAGFELQHRYLGEASKAQSTAAFSALAFIEGHGTTEAAQDYAFRLDDLEPGRHVFRLKQIDYDGTFAYSPEIEVAIELPEAYLVSAVYPNPFNPQASFSFSVSRSQEVTVAVYNMLGQRVSVLFEGVVSEGTSRTMQIDGSGLQSGTYIVRVQGEVFVHTQTITLVK